MKKKYRILLVLLFCPFIISAFTVGVRSFDHKSYTRVVFESTSQFAYDYNLQQNEIELTVKSDSADVQEILKNGKKSLLLADVSVFKNSADTKVTLKFRHPVKIRRNFVLEKPFRVVFDLTKSEEEPPVSESQVNSANSDNNVESPEKENSNTDKDTDEKKNSTKKLKIETICIDPGHGGNDLGAVGSANLMEKDVTLKIAGRLKKLIESKLGLRVITTRNKDSEVSLNSRAAIANNQKAQMFVSIHANSSYRKNVRGPETFFVSLKATDSAASELAKKENASYEEIEKKASNDDLKMILWNMAQTEYIKESSVLADFIQFELNEMFNTKNRGVKQAPFRVLMRAAMPAVLVEVAFISNPHEEKKLKEEKFLDELSSAIYRGVVKFINYYNNNIV